MRPPHPQIFYIVAVFLIACVLCLFLLPAAARDGERMARKNQGAGAPRQAIGASLSVSGVSAASLSGIGESTPHFFTASEQIGKP